jgi:ribosomal protein S18 acetylase RimI-like enzyme
MLKRRGRTASARAVRLSIEPHASEEEKRIVREAVDLHNVAATGLSDFQEMSIFLRDGDDEIVGGALGYLWGGWLHLTFLWVARAQRGHGHARRLVRAAEKYALEHDCEDVLLDSFSFQAPGLYRKLGYEAFAEIGRPPGHRQVFLRRRLTADPSKRRARRARRSRPPTDEE